MIATLIVSAALGGIGCNVGVSCNYGYQPTIYCPPTNYHVNDAYYNNQVVVPRIEVASYLKIADTERELQLQIIRQQTLMFEQELKFKNELILRNTLPPQPPPAATPVPRLQPQATPQPPTSGPPLADLASARSAVPNRSRGAKVITERCATCHVNPTGLAVRWKWNPDEAATPDWRTRIRIKDAVTRSQKRMPPGESLPEQDLQAIDEYCQFTPDELTDPPGQGLAKK